MKVDWNPWCRRRLTEEDSVLTAIGERRDGQKALLAIGNMGGEKPSGGLLVIIDPQGMASVISSTLAGLQG